jgi:hypothetical protein
MDTFTKERLTKATALMRANPNLGSRAMMMLLNRLGICTNRNKIYKLHSARILIATVNKLPPHLECPACGFFAIRQLSMKPAAIAQRKTRMRKKAGVKIRSTGKSISRWCLANGVPQETARTRLRRAGFSAPYGVKALSFLNRRHSKVGADSFARGP